MSKHFLNPTLVIPASERVYAIGDIHGDITGFLHVLDKIRLDLQSNPLKPHQQWRLVCLGDYVDGGMNSREVLDTLVRLKNHDPRHVCLQGNHDSDFFAHAQYLRDMNGIESPSEKTVRSNLSTFKSYAPEITHGNYAELCAVAADIPETHLSFLGDLPFSARFANYLFIHNLADAALEDSANQDEYQAHKAFLYGDYGTRTRTTPLFEDIIVVHGHRNAKGVNHAEDGLPPEIHPHRIGLNDVHRANGRIVGTDEQKQANHGICWGAFEANTKPDLYREEIDRVCMHPCDAAKLHAAYRASFDEHWRIA